MNRIINLFLYNLKVRNLTLIEVKKEYFGLK